MADLNSMIAQGAQFQAPVDPFAQYGKLQQLQQNQQANALNQMKMDEYVRGQQESNALRQFLPTLSEGNRNQLLGFGAAGQNLFKTLGESDTQRRLTDQAKSQADVNKSTILKNVVAQTRDAVAGIDPTDAPSYMALRDSVLAQYPELAPHMPAAWDANVQQRLITTAASLLERQKPEPGFTLSPGQMRFPAGYGGVVSAPAAPAAPTPLAKLQAEKAALPPGDPRNAAYDAAIVKESQFAPNAEPLAEFSAFLKLPPAQQAEFVKFKKAGATNVSATATTSPTGRSLSEPVGKLVETSLVKAQGATSVMETANSVRDALNAGNVIAGPLAGARTKFAQVLELAGAGDKEKLVNTRTAIQGLAGLTLESRSELKGQGQITDSETKLLEKARSGNLDEMTIPELQQVVNISQRFANKLWSNHQSLLGKMKDDPAAKDSIRYYEPTAQMAPPILEGKTPSAQRKDDKRPSLGSIFGGVAPTGGVPQGRK